ncbi:hypothetical protein JOF36_007109 [Pseudonocardia parietis]|uniref:Uncharacterized protein n=1 Tax=Pseudonocardia parietis TaxID=570936 RepID=A0ABS4W5S2_9PSEU|nr:hypothetical protein [Pseudonocardia parietis]
MIDRVLEIDLGWSAVLVLVVAQQRPAGESG